MAISTIKASFPCDVQKVWDAVTNLSDCTWRSDLDRIEVLNDIQFVEYTKDGYATTFTVTCTKPCRHWEFDMENGSMKGHWAGIFSQEGAVTTVEFTEDVTAKKTLMKPFVKLYLKKQQTRYIEDLKKALAR